MWRSLLEPFVAARQRTKNTIPFDEFIQSLGDVEVWPKDLPCDNNSKKGTADKTKGHISLWQY